MFTGIIQKVAAVVEAQASGPSLRLTLASGWRDLELGESVAVNGVCLTVAERDPQGGAVFFVSPETLHRSNLGMLKPGYRANLERAVTLNTRLSGHLVQGHVDGQARLLDIREEQGGSRVITFELLAELARYCVEKGSITLDGTSLTINRIEPVESAFKISITLIPHTWEHTRFSSTRAGDWVNVEVDVMAKYVEKLCQPYAKPSRV